MAEDERAYVIRELLLDFVRSPSLRHLRDPHSIDKLITTILRRLDVQQGIWRKWDGQRELIVKSALACWIGDQIGKYQRRGDATKVVAEIAYKPEPRW
jgi:hypothetical protein